MGDAVFDEFKVAEKEVVPDGTAAKSSETASKNTAAAVKEGDEVDGGEDEEQLDAKALANRKKKDKKKAKQKAAIGGEGMWGGDGEGESQTKVEGVEDAAAKPAVSAAPPAPAPKKGGKEKKRECYSESCAR